MLSHLKTKVGIEVEAELSKMRYSHDPRPNSVHVGTRREKWPQIGYYMARAYSK